MQIVFMSLILNMYYIEICTVVRKLSGWSRI